MGSVFRTKDKLIVATKKIIKAMLHGKICNDDF